MVCSKGCSNLFSCHRQLKGEEYEERSSALILDALKEFLDLFAAIMEGFLLWPLFPAQLCRGSRGEQLHSRSSVMRWEL